jgi:SAM-dependent methyltransferase
VNAAPRYGEAWIGTFLDTVPPEQTAREVAFIQAALPLFTHPRLLDVCCGDGRHARPLALAGYAVTGIDENEGLLARARQRWLENDAPGLAADDALDPRAPVFRLHDMRAILVLGDTFDAVTCMWASFGFFDAATNESVLAQMAATVRPGGRILLDIYDRDFFARHAGRRTLERNGSAVVEEKSLEGDVLTVRLDYGGGAVDTFRWQVFTPAELQALAATHGLRAVSCCAGFQPDRTPAGEQPRMQLVLERT